MSFIDIAFPDLDFVSPTCPRQEAELDCHVRRTIPQRYRQVPLLSLFFAGQR